MWPFFLELVLPLRETEGGGQAQRVGHWVPREAFPDLVPGVYRT